MDQQAGRQTTTIDGSANGAVDAAGMARMEPAPPLPPVPHVRPPEPGPPTPTPAQAQPPQAQAPQAQAPQAQAPQAQAPQAQAPQAQAPQAQAPQAQAPQAQAQPSARPSAVPAANRWLAAIGGPQTLRIACTSLLLLAAFLLGLAAYLFGLSATSEDRSQTILYAQLRNELSQAVAPVGPTTPGQPIAILDFPTIGIRNLVVVEGTSPENLMLGPGVVRNSPLPGQAGVSEIYGRLATFGAPFSHLGQLRVGDEIKVTTGQGVAIYKVAAFGDSGHLVVDPAANRLILLTAGSPYVPTYYSYVDADLVSAVQPQPGGLPPIYPDETPLSGDTGALVLTLLWGMALAGASTISALSAARWGRWPAYLAAAPVVIVVVWNLYHSLAALLPNVY